MAQGQHHLGPAEPSVWGGRPHLANSRITVAGKYDLSLASLHAAMAYYYDHQADVDCSLREDVAFEQAFRHDNPSPFKEKLSTLEQRG